MKKLNKCIGIISYLPEDKHIRNIRIEKLIKLLNKVNSLFNLPILLLAQNYSDEEKQLVNLSNVQIKSFGKGLGIAHAREELRLWFIQTQYDVIILLDDDSEIVGDDANKYLEIIDVHPTQLGTMYGAIHKLMAVPRNIYEKYSYDLVNTPEAHTGYEDTIFHSQLLRDKVEMYKFNNTQIQDISSSIIDDKDSTWSINLSEDEINHMLQNTASILGKNTGLQCVAKKYTKNKK